MALTSTVPTRCIVRHPTSQSVWFCGVAINLSQLAESWHPPLDQSYLSRIFAGERIPSLDYMERIATGLGMQLQALHDELKKLRR